LLFYPFVYPCCLICGVADVPSAPSSSLFFSGGGQTAPIAKAMALFTAL
jgi:hypothetical protein